MAKKVVINTAKYLVGTSISATPGVASLTYVDPPGFPVPNQADARTLGTFSGTITNTDAKQKSQIDALIGIYKVLINLSTANQKERDLRERILQIALSYVGQKTYWLEYYERYGFIDQLMEKKYENIGWKNDQAPLENEIDNSGRHYCNYTVNLIWTEAFQNGNTLVPYTTSYPNNIKSSVRYGNAFRPSKLRSTFPSFTYAQGDDKDFYGLMTPGTVNTAKNFNQIGKYVTINQDVTLFEKAYKNGKGKIKPGDAIMFDWQSTKTISGIDHIGIFVSAAKRGKQWVITTIEGNSRGSKDIKFPDGRRVRPNGIFIQERYISKIAGFCQLFTNDDL